MDTPKKDDPVDRREFLKGAAASAAAFIGDGRTPTVEHPHSHDQEHAHQAVPSDIALRVKALESVLVEKGMVDPRAIDAAVDL